MTVDFGVSEESVRRWMRQADIDDGIRDGPTSAEQTELVQLRRDKRRLEMGTRFGVSTDMARWRMDATGARLIAARKAAAYRRARNIAQVRVLVLVACGPDMSEAIALPPWDHVKVEVSPWADSGAAGLPRLAQSPGR